MSPSTDNELQSENNKVSNIIDKLENLLSKKDTISITELEFLDYCFYHHSDATKILCLLTKIFYNQGLTIRSNDCIYQLLLLSNNNLEAIDDYIECLLHTGNHLELTQLSNKSPKTLLIANSFSKLNLPEKAISLLSEKKKGAPKNFRIYQRLHQIYIEHHNYLAAEYLVEEFKYHLPKMIPMHTLLSAKGLKAAGETDKAILLFCEKVDIENLNPNMFSFLFSCLIDRGELDILKKIVRSNLSKIIGKKHIVFQIMRHYVFKNDFEFAEHLQELIKDTLQQGYETIQYLNIDAQLKLRQFKYHEAHEIFNQLMNIHDKKNKNTYLNIGYTLTMQNELSKAREFFDLTWFEDQKKENPNKNNINQYLYGRLWNEIALNTFANKKIENALSESHPSRSLAILRQLVLDEPHYTGAYLHYLVQLRLSGKFNNHSTSNENYIPKQIVQYWDENELAPDLKFITQSWSKQNPDWEYILFNDTTAISFIGRNFPKPVLVAYLRCEKAAMKSDLFRLCYLTINGGVYSDTDDRCNRSLNTLIQGKKLIMCQDRWGAVANNFIAAEPQNPTIIRALNEVIQNILDDPNDAIWYATGPGITSQCVAHAIASYSNDSIVPEWMKIITLKELYEFVWPHTKNAYKSTSKHWLNSDN